MDPRQTFPKKIRYFFEYLLFLILCKPIQWLSARSVFELGKKAGTLFYHLAKKRRHIARINLDIAFGDSKTLVEKNRIIKQSFLQMAISTFQCIWVMKYPERRVHQLIDTEPKGLDEIKSCVSEGKGIFFLTAHYGNWEIMGLYHGYLNVCQLNSIARKLDNPFLEKLIMNLRTISGNGIFHKNESPRKMVRAVKNNCSVAIMMDQNGGDGGMFVNFFGKMASTPRALATLSYKTEAPIIPMFCYPKEEGKYKVQYGPRLNLEKTGNKEEDIYRWTQECELYIEKIIKGQPEPWMWFHRRWKSRPKKEDKENNIYKT